MEILWWLVPSVVVAVATMAWVGWLGREGRGELDRDVALSRLTKALEREYATPRRTDVKVRDRSTGIAVRPTRESSGVDGSTRPSG